MITRPRLCPIVCSGLTVVFLMMPRSCVYADNHVFPPQPNIIHILADDLGWGEVGFNGSGIVETPNLDEMAENGLKFTTAYVTSPICAPARGSLLTGFHSGHAAVDRNADKVGLRDDDPTIGDILGAAGYATAVFGKWGFGGTPGERVEPKNGFEDSLRRNPRVTGLGQLPHNQGFAEFYGYLNHVRAHSYYVDALWENDANAKNGVRLVPTGNSLESGRISVTHDLISDRSEVFIKEKSKSGKPFYMQLNYAIPHAYWEDIKYVQGASELYTNDALMEAGSSSEEIRYIAYVAAMITHMDNSIGSLVERLRDPDKNGDYSDSILPNTIIFFTSDNGADWPPRLKTLKSNGPFRGEKREVYEGGIRVPLLVYWVDESDKPRIVTGATDFPTDIADFLPTAAELGGTRGPVGTDGVSILPVITGNGIQQIRDYFYFEENEAGSYRGTDTGLRNIRHRWAVLDTERMLKLIYWQGDTGSDMAGETGYELYNLKDEPQERVDLLAIPEDRDYPDYLRVKNELSAIAIAEGANKPDEYAVTYREWRGTNGRSLTEALNWSEPGTPEGNWSARVYNATASERTAVVGSNMNVLGIEVGGVELQQRILVAPGIALDGRNEVRVCANGNITLRRSILRSNRQVNITAGGEISGQGRIEGDVRNEGLVLARSPDRRLNSRWDTVPPELETNRTC